MERQDSYTFDDEEIHILAEALAMYAAYNEHMVLPMLIGDESDLDNIVSRANTTKRLARHFVEEDEGVPWEELSAQFASVHERPMDWSDVSEFDWFEHAHSEDS